MSYTIQSPYSGNDTIVVRNMKMIADIGCIAWDRAMDSAIEKMKDIKLVEDK